jgi:hypothetical protein
MNSWNLTVKGYVNGEDGADPVVTSMLTMEELEGILSPIRQSFNNLGDSLTFDISFRDIDI